MNFYFNVAISAAVGTLFIEVIFKLFLEHWLKERYYLFTVQKADRRECANILLEILNPVNAAEWDNDKASVYFKAFHLMDRLVTLNEQSYAEKLGNYTTNQIMVRLKLKGQFPTHQNEDLVKDIAETEVKISKEREELLKIAKDLKK